MDLFLNIFTLGSITRQPGKVENVSPASSFHSTASIPLQATLPFGWLVVGVAFLAVFQSAAKLIPFNSLWQRCLYQSFQLLCNVLLIALTVYSHLLLVAAGLEAPFLYLLALIYFLQCVVFGRLLVRCWLCWKCKSKNPLIYDSNYFVCWHTHTHDYCIPYNSITNTIVLTAGDGVTIPIRTQDYQIGGYFEKWESGVKDYLTLIGPFTEVYYQLESTQISTDTGINNATFFLFSKNDEREQESVQVHTIDGSSGVVNPIYDEPTPTTSVPL
ncbi:ORF3 protein [Bat coronavirus BM48-31/BGR/2008]|uniref:ORF3 protein n=1 Tax=Bat coronavirus BM48-31/BGR/2008 TaxID=864596 RepID=UPI0001E13BE3|nr:ORF3 protein [Bat coronavirus BM48-31/BGR/2008]ADK66842.1 ORF3 [Bat coronavirus BM48-31/BGR/2008]